MSLRLGDIVTPAFLVEYFRRVIVAINDVKNVDSLTSGQVLNTDNGTFQTFVNQYSEQFYDNQAGNYLDRYYSNLTDIEG